MNKVFIFGSGERVGLWDGFDDVDGVVDEPTVEASEASCEYGKLGGGRASLLGGVLIVDCPDYELVGAEVAAAPHKLSHQCDICPFIYPSHPVTPINVHCQLRQSRLSHVHLLFYTQMLYRNCHDALTHPRKSPDQKYLP